MISSPSARLGAVLSLSVLCLPGLGLAQSPDQAQDRTRIEPGRPQPLSADLLRPEVQDPRYAPVEDTNVRNLSVTALDDSPNFVPTRDLNPGAVDDTNQESVIDGNPYRLDFKGGSYAPARGIDPRLIRDLQANPDASVFGYVMIKGRINTAKLKTLTELGVEMLGFHPWQTLKAKIPAQALPGLMRSEFVHWAGYAQPEQKIDRVLAEAMAVAKKEDRLDVWVNFFASDMGPNAQTLSSGENRTLSAKADVGAIEWILPNGPFQKQLEALGFRFTFYSDAIFAMRGLATKAEIEAIRGLNFVHSIELQHGVGSIDQDQSLAQVGVDRVRATYPGTGVALGYIDTGIDNSPWHRDFGGQKFRAWDTTGAGAYSDGHSHGTHVAGTIFGRGRADIRYMGVAPSLGTGSSATDRIYVGRLLNNSGSIVGAPQTLWNRFKTPQTISGTTTPKRMVVSNSWSLKSSSGYNGTEANSRDLDTVIHTYQQTYVHSSGNTSASVSGSWCGSPSCAKNVLTVGSVRDWYSSTVQPGDVVSNVRYKTTDNRRKPEVTAPGETLTSTRNNSTTGYTNKSGTSMSTPTVSGILASVIDRSTAFYDYNPSGLKALAVASGKRQNLLTFDSTYKEGFGMVNAYKMNYGNSRSTFYNKSGDLSYPFPSLPQNLDTFDYAIPSDLVAMKVVLTWTEPAASASATKARVNALRLYADIPPYTSGATGEYSMSNSRDTVIYTASSTWLNAMKGKTVRFKVHAYTLLPGQKCNWSVCIFQYRKTPTASATLSQTVNKTVVRPGQTVQLSSTLSSSSTTDEFVNAQIYYSSPSSWTMTRIDRTTADGNVQSYTGSSHPSNPYPSLGAGITRGMGVGSGASRNVKFTLRAPSTNGNHRLYTRAIYNGRTTSILSNSRTVCVDSQAPSAIQNLKSTTHTAGQWSNKTTLTHTWNRATDNGCAGVLNLPYTVTLGSAGTPNASSPAKSAGTTSDSRTVSNTSTGYYFNLRVRDRVDYYGTKVSVGPYKIDTTRPTVSTVSINRGATRTASLSCSITASGADTYSGIQYMQYSANGSSWSGLYAYTTGARTLNIATLPGGSTAEGTKRVYVRFRDRAGNYSTARSDTISYMAPPVISSATISSLEAVNTGYFRLVGTGFTETQYVVFGGRRISTKFTSAHANWWNTGCFRVLSDTVVYVYPPQAQKIGTYSLRTYNGLSTSNSVSVKIVRNSGTILRSNRVITTGSTQTIHVTRGKLPATVTQQVTVASLSNRPSVAPGLFNFQLGNSFSNWIQFPGLPFNSEGVSSLSFKVPASAKGMRIYYQCGYLDFTSNVVWPMPASTGLQIVDYR